MSMHSIFNHLYKHAVPNKNITYVVDDIYIQFPIQSKCMGNDVL